MGYVTPNIVARSIGAGLLVAAAFVAPPSRAASDPACGAAYEEAQLLRKRGELMAARDAAVACARASCPAVVRRDCTAWVAELERDIPSVIVIARDEATGDEGGGRVTVDGTVRPELVSGRAFSLDPGAHVFRVERPGSEPAEQTITIVRGDHDRVLRFVLRSERVEASRSANAKPPSAVAVAPQRAQPSYFPAVVAGLGSLAIFGVAAGFGLTGRRELSDLRGSCAPVCSDEQLDPVRTKLIVSDVAFGVGLVGALVTTFLIVSPPSSSVRVGRSRVVITPTASGGAVLSGAF